MKKWTQEEINEAVRLHRLWLIGAEKGVKADLSMASLSGASLSWADLSMADLSGANGVKRCSVDWDGHGECGRKLSSIRIGEEDRYFCGCFSGTLQELRAFISSDAKKHQASRTMVVDFVAACMAKKQSA